MTEPIPYAYKALYLTKEETIDGKNFGLKFVLENEDRWEDISDSTYELQTYDRGTSQVVHDNKVYMVFKDFIFVDNATRVFLCKCYESAVDTYEEPTEGDETEETTFKPNSITVAGKYDYLTKETSEEPDSDVENPEDSESSDSEITE